MLSIRNPSRFCQTRTAKRMGFTLEITGCGPGKRADGQCATPAWHGMADCEPWQGNCPCNWPNTKCPGTSSPGKDGGYVWLPFTWKKLKVDPLYLVCAHSSWDMKSPPGDNATCYTFNVFPDSPFTQGLDERKLVDYRGQHVPYVESSCGFIACPGWPMSEAANSDNTTACCAKLGDAITQARNGGRCRADNLCMGKCREDQYENIPGGHGGCAFSAFNPSKARLIGDANGSYDCTQVRAPGAAVAPDIIVNSDHLESGEATQIVDPCRGEHAVPSK